MIRLALALSVCALAGAGSLHAQRPEVSPALDRPVPDDTTLTLWFFARPSIDVSAVEAFVRSEGGTVRRVSRWLRAVSAEVPARVLATARLRADLARVQPVRRFRRNPPPPSPPSPPAPAAVAATPTQDSAYGPSAMPLRRLNIFPLVARGFRGAGVRIAILDTGFETELAPFASTTIVAQYDFVFNDSIVRNEAADVTSASVHGTSVWSLLAADVADTLIGIAPDALYLLAKTEDVRSETPLEEDNYVAALEWADSVGVDIVSSSVGYTTFDDLSGYGPGDLNGDIAVTTVAADLAADRGILVVTAAGNLGTTTLITPADGDSVIAVGAEDSLGVVAAFSSRGPTADGRTKPDLSAPGVAVWVAQPSGGTAVYGRANGTSFSTPIVAGASALFTEIHPTYSPTDVRDALQRAADNVAAPDNDRGWGRPDLHRAVTFPRGLVLASPGPAVLTTVTPTFAWSVPDLPAFAQPATYRLRVATDTTFAVTVLDTTTADTSVTLLTALAPGSTVAFEVTATTADSLTAVAGGDTSFAIPEWVTLEGLDEPGGTSIRELRPRFKWSVPDIETPPGPFVFDVDVIRVIDGEIELAAESLTATVFVPTRDLEGNTPYRWRVTAHAAAAEVTVESRGTFIIVDNSAPPVTALFQNFPNPFPNLAIGQTATCFWFDLAVEGVVRFDILDLRGHVVRTLIPGSELGPFLRPGRYGRPDGFVQARCDPRLEWDGTTLAGGGAPPGVYLARLVTPDGTFFKRIAFMGLP